MFFAEDLLHYIWKFRLFNQQDLRTADGSSVQIISPGTQHQHAGPDFQNAKIRIDETVWAGNVEIHICASDWKRHEHSKDASYNTVILHVVCKNDLEILNEQGLKMQVLVLENRIEDSLLLKYQNLIYTESLTFPCEKIINRVDDFVIYNWLDRMLIERLNQKSAQVLQKVAFLKGNWEEAFYQTLAANFGFKVNALPFELLTKALPLQILAKHTHSLLQTEALIFGQAGFLNDSHYDDYYLCLQKEYHFLQQKYSLLPVEKYLWKFLRLRPLNFPTIRLAQFAVLMHRSSRFLAEILKAEAFANVDALFNEINPSPYWLTHYQFDKESKPGSKKLGQASVENLLVNTVTTFLFAYAKENRSEKHQEKALQLLEKLPCENNFIMSSFIKAGVKLKSAANSQAIIELKHNYCDRKRCLECGIGNKLLKTS